MSITSFLKNTFVKSIGSGFPTIVLNGGPGLSYNYLYKVLEPFSGKNNCLIFYDQLGCGASKVEDKYINLENNLIQLSEVIDYYVSNNFNILTHSWGNWLALEYLRTKSSEEGKNLNKIIAVSPVALNNIGLEESFQYVKNNLSLADKLQLEQLMSNPTEDSEIYVLELILNNLTSNSEKLYFDGKNNLITAKSGNKFVFDSFSFKIAKHLMSMICEGYDHKEIVYNSTTKIDFILGGQDPLPGKEIFEAWEENPEFISRVEIPEVGHLPFLEDPETFDVILGET
jgi:proline iminopeptidase